VQKLTGICNNNIEEFQWYHNKTMMF
jgi:hypothetical protein